MLSPDPITLLKETLNDHEISLLKSINLYNNGLIEKSVHDVHKKNLQSLIDQYKYAIYKLEK